MSLEPQTIVTFLVILGIMGKYLQPIHTAQVLDFLQ